MAQHSKAPSPEPPCEPPWLNRTAHALSADVWLLFQTIRKQCGLETAVFLFQRAIQEGQAAPKKHPLDVPLEGLAYPTIKQIAHADRRQVCIWYAKLRQPKTQKEESVCAHIQKRYVEFEGYTAEIMKEISAMKPPPPRKRHGSHKEDKQQLLFWLRKGLRNSKDSEFQSWLRKRKDPAFLLWCFDESNPDSPLSAAKHGELKIRDGLSLRRMTKQEFAALFVPQYGETSEHVLRHLKYLRTRN